MYLVMFPVAATAAATGLVRSGWYGSTIVVGVFPFCNVREYQSLLVALLLILEVQVANYRIDATHYLCSAVCPSVH